MFQVFRGLIVVVGYAITTAVGTAQQADDPDSQESPRVTQQAPANDSPAPLPATDLPEERGTNAARNATPEMWGATLDYVPASLRSHVASVLSGDVGVMVRGVEDGSPAQTAGIQPTDVLLKFNDRYLASPQQLESWLAENGSSPARLQVLQAGEEKQVTIVPESGKRQRATRMRSRSDSLGRDTFEQAQTGGLGADWDKLFQGGQTVYAFGGQTESGSVSLQGTGDGVTLNADYRDRRGKRRQMRMQGRPQDLDANLRYLPGDLRDLIRNQVGEQESWDKLLGEPLKFNDRFPF